MVITEIVLIFVTSKIKNNKVMKIERTKKSIYLRTEKFSLWFGWLSFSKDDCFIPTFYFNKF